MEPTAPTSSPQLTPSPDHPLYDSPKPVRHPKLAILSFVLILAAAGGGYWYGHRGNTTTATTQPTKSTGSTSATEQVAYSIGLDPGVSNSGPIYAKLSLSAPVSWRSTVGEDKAACAINDTDYQICSPLQFANAVGTPATIEQTNNLQPLDITSWLGKSTKVPQGLEDPHLGNVYTVADKAKAVAATLAITATSKLTTSNIVGSKPTLLNPFFTNAAIVQVGDVTPVVSADGSLHGYAFIATIAQAQDYNPYVYVSLVGKSGASTVAVYGKFKINDQHRADFVAAEAKANFQAPSWLSDDASAGYYLSDTLAQYNQVLGTMKTLSLSK